MRMIIIILFLVLAFVAVLFLKKYLGVGDEKKQVKDEKPEVPRPEGPKPEQPKPEEPKKDQ